MHFEVVLYSSICLAQLSISRPTSSEFGVGQASCRTSPSSWRLQRFASSMQVITVVPGNRVYLQTGSLRSVLTVGSVTATVVLETMSYLLVPGTACRTVLQVISVVIGNRAYFWQRSKWCCSCRWIVGRYRGFCNNDTTPVKILN